ncbi:MAG: hypothetical protein ABI200_07860 [Gaiellales bacterium]
MAQAQVQWRAKIGLAVATLMVMLVMTGPGAPLATAASGSVDMSGTVTVIERIDDTTANERYDHLARVRWKLPGKLQRRHGLVVSQAAAQVLEYRDRRDTLMGEDGLPSTDCRIEQFVGFRAEQGQAPGTTQLAVEAATVNPRIKRARVSIQLPETAAPVADMSSGFCHDMTPRPDFRYLVNRSGVGVNAGSKALIGIGAFRRARNKDGWESPTTVMSPTNVLMRYSKGRWRAAGTRTIRGTLWNGTPAVYTIKWRLVSRQPSLTCSGIPQRLVRGRTLTQVRRTIRSAGFRPGKLVRVSHERGQSGRVTSISSSRSMRCGARIDLNVRR